MPGCEAEQWGRPAGINKKKNNKKNGAGDVFSQPVPVSSVCTRRAACEGPGREGASSARDGNMEVELHTDKGRSIQMC